MPLRTSPCAKAGSAAAETNGAVVRMVLLGLTAKYYTISAAVKSKAGVEVEGGRDVRVVVRSPSCRVEWLTFLFVRYARPRNPSQLPRGCAA